MQRLWHLPKTLRRYGRIAEAALYLAFAATAKRYLGLSKLVKIFGPNQQPPSAHTIQHQPPSPHTAEKSAFRLRLEAVHYGELVEAVGSVVPWQTKCLDKALAAAMMLKMRSIPFNACLGVAKTVEGKHAWHMWLESGGKIITGRDESDGFTLLTRWSRA